MVRQLRHNNYINDLDPPQPRAREEQFDVARRDKGAGHPTKKERRDTDQLRSVW